MIEIARLAEEAGIDGLIVSAGTPGGQKFEDLGEAHKVMRTLPMMTEPGCLVPIAAEFKKALRIPVVTVGRINTIALAEEILSQGKADIAAIGRALLADPDLPNKALEGREEETRPCIACNEGCYKRILGQLDICCSVNPNLGREAEPAAPKADPAKRIVVVGAGPAGMEAACRARERGHDVTLIDKGRRVGGQLLLAAVPPGRKDITLFTDYLAGRLARSGVKVFLNEEISPTRIRSLRPDAVILATGRAALRARRPRACRGTVADRLGRPGGKVDPGGPLSGGGRGAGRLRNRRLPERGGGEGDGGRAPPRDRRRRGQGHQGLLRHPLPRKGRRRPHRGDPGADGGASRRSSAGATRSSGSRPGRWFSPWGQNPTTPWARSWPPRASTVIMAGDCVKPRRIMDSVREGFLAGNRV